MAVSWLRFGSLCVFSCPNFMADNIATKAFKVELQKRASFCIVNSAPGNHVCNTC